MARTSPEKILTTPLIFSCRNLQIRFTTIAILLKYTNSEQTRELCEDSPELRGFLVHELEHALAQVDHINRKYTTNYRSDNILELLASLCVSSDAVVDQLVPLGLAKQLVAALNVDVLKANVDRRLKLDVLYSAKCTYAVLLVANGKYKDIIMRVLGGSVQGLQRHSLISSLLFSLLASFNNNTLEGTLFRS